MLMKTDLPFNPTHRDQYPWLINALFDRPLVGAEVGVQTGAYSEVLLRSVTWERFYCIDAWRQLENYVDAANVADTEQECCYQQALQRLAPYARKVRVLRELSTEATGWIADGSLDFCYIDANHSFEAVAADIAAYFPKIRPGGILAGHDYCGCWPGVMQAVDQFVGEHGQANFYHHPAESSWLFFKPR